MGKILKTNIEFVNSKVNTLLNALANIAFKQLPKPEMTELDWGENTPSLTSPQNGDEVNVGTIPSGGTSVTKTITIKGKSLGSAVNLAVSGTGFSLSANSVSAAEANAGTTVIITYTDNGTGDGQDKTGTLTVSSAGSEFTQRTVSLKAKKLVPGVVEPVVSLATNEYLELTGSLSDGTYSGVLSVKSAYSSTKGLPFPEDISAVMGGASKAITYDDSTGAITISGVTADVTITAAASVVDGVDYQNNPIRWKEGLYFSNANSDSTTNDNDWCISDYYHIDGDAIVIFGAGAAYTNHYMCLYNSSKQYLGKLGLSKRLGAFDLTQSSIAVIANGGTAYIRLCLPIAKRASRFVYDAKNKKYVYSGSDYDGRYDGLVWASSWCIHGATGSIPEGTYIDDADSTTTGGKPTYCRNAAYLALQTSSNSFEYSVGFRNASNANDYDRRCMELRDDDNTYGGRLFPHSGTSKGTTVYGFDYFEFTNASASYNGIRGSFSIDNLDDCYIYDKVNGVYLFRGMNNPIAVADNSGDENS